MMRNVIAVLMVALIALAGCDGRMTTWGVTGQTTDLTGRVGYEDEGVEAGVVMKWAKGSDISWGPEPDQVGAYVILEASWDVQAEDTGEKAPAPVSWLENLHMIPYVGMELVDAIEDDEFFGDIQPNWIAGVKFMVDPEDGKVAIVTEYVDGDVQAGEVNLGLMYLW